MKATLSICGTVLLLLSAVPARAQTTRPAVEDFKPSALNQAGRQYPQVNSEGRAGFASPRRRPRA